MKRTDLAAATSCHSLLLLDDRASELERKWVAEMAPLVLSLSAGPTSPSRLCRRLKALDIIRRRGEARTNARENKEPRKRLAVAAGDLSQLFLALFPCLCCLSCRALLPPSRPFFFFLSRYLLPGGHWQVSLGQQVFVCACNAISSCQGHQAAVVMKDVTFFYFCFFSVTVNSAEKKMDK